MALISAPLATYGVSYAASNHSTSQSVTDTFETTGIRKLVVEYAFQFSTPPGTVVIAGKGTNDSSLSGNYPSVWAPMAVSAPAGALIADGPSQVILISPTTSPYTGSFVLENLAQFVALFVILGGGPPFTGSVDIKIFGWSV